MDELSPEAKAFLARADRVHHEDELVKRRVRRALSVSLASPAALPSNAADERVSGLDYRAPPVPSPHWLSLSSGKLAGSLAALSLVCAAGWFTLRPTSAPTRALPRPALPAALASSSTSASTAPSTHPPSAAQSLSDDAPATPPPVDAAARRGRSQDSRELTLLSQATQALEQAELARARKLLTRHQRRYPDSALAEERSALTLLLACRERQPNASARMETFLASHPHAVLALRLRRACAAD